MSLQGSVGTKFLRNLGHQDILVVRNTALVYVEHESDEEHDTLCLCAAWCNQLFNCAIVRLCDCAQCARLEVLKERRWHKAGVSPWPWVEPTHSCYPEATHPSPTIHESDETLIHKYDSQRRAGKRVVFQRAGSIGVYIAGWLRGDRN